MARTEARTEAQIMGSLITERDSSNTHSGVLSEITEQYRIQNSEYDKTVRFADFQTAMQETIKESLLEQQISSLATGKKLGKTTNNFEEDELTKFFTEELTGLVSDVSDMTRDQLKVQKKRIELLSTSLVNSDTKEKEFLMEQYAKSIEFLEQEYDKKNGRMARTWQVFSKMGEQYLDFQALYSGFFNNNPLAMLAFKLGGDLWKASKKRKDDEKKLVENDIHKQQIAIKTEEDKQQALKNDKSRATRLKDAKKEYGKKQDDSLVERERNEPPQDDPNSSGTLNNATSIKTEIIETALIKNTENESESSKSESESSKDISTESSKDISTGTSLIERNNSIEDAIQQSEVELNSESNPMFVQNIEDIQGDVDGSVADEIHQNVEEKADRKKQQDYYQDTRKWQKNMLKCICPNGKSSVFSSIGAGKSSSGDGSGGGLLGAIGTLGSGLLRTLGTLGSSLGLLGAGIMGAGGVLATKEGALKDKIKGMFTRTPSPDTPNAPNTPKKGGMLGGAMDFIKKHKKVSAVVAGGALYLGMGSDEADAKTMPDVPKSITRDHKGSGLTGNHEKDIEKQVSSDSFNAVMTDVALSSATMLKTVKAIPGLGVVAGAVGDTGLEYAQGGSVLSSATVGGGAIAGSMAGGALGLQIGTALAPFTAGLSVPIVTALGAIGGSIVGAMGASEVFGDTDQEKKDNLTTRNLDKRKIIDRNDLVGWEDSKILAPGKLQNLSINELKSLIAIDDFTDEDYQLIKETLEVKQGYRSKLSKKVKAHLDESIDNALVDRLENKEIIDRNSLIPFKDAIILKPETLKDLSISQLKALLNSDDFSDEDFKLIKETIEMKEGLRDKYSRASQNRIDTSVNERKQIIRDEKANETAEFLADKGIVDLDYLGDSEIKKPELLKTLPIEQLEELLDFNDWDEEDESLIQETIDNKKTGKKLSKGNQSRVNEASLERLEESGVYEKNTFGKDTLGSAEELNKLDIETLTALKKDGSFDESSSELLEQTIAKKSTEKKILSKDNPNMVQDEGVSIDGKIIKETDSSETKEQTIERNHKQSLLGENPMENATDRQAIDGMLDKIGKAESNNNYDAEWGGGKYGKRGKKLTEMTIGEVKAYQKEMLNTQKGMGKSAGQRSSALGKYQFISGSMKEVQAMTGLSDDALYNEENQDMMGEMWLRKRGGLDKFNKSKKTKKDADKLQNKVASQWASMKNTNGRGAYDGDGMNTARHSVRDEINQMVNNNNQKSVSKVKQDNIKSNSFIDSEERDTSVVDKLSSDSTSNDEMVARIESTNDEIKQDKEDKQNQPPIVQQISSNSKTEGSGGGDVGNSAVGSARNNNSSLQRITDRYISSGMS